MKKNALILLFIVFHFIPSFYSQPNITVTAPVPNIYSQSLPAGGSIYTNYSRGVFLITANELSALLSSSITSFGFSLEKGTGDISVTGTIAVYLQNTSDVTYNKGSVFATAISAMTNIYSGNMTIPAPYGPASILFNNITPAFNYTGGGIYVAYDWKRTTTASTGEAWYYTTKTSQNMAAYNYAINYSPTTFTNIGMSNERPVCIFNAINSAVNEAEVVLIGAPGKVPESLHTGHIITADIQNKSINALSNVNVTLSVSGVNSFADVQVISAIAPGAIQTVSFAPFHPITLGTNLISVTVPNDQNNTNNSVDWNQAVTCKVASNSPPAPTYTTGLGNQNNPILCLSRFNFKATNTLTAVNLGIGNDYTPNVELYGVILDNNGTILATTNTLNASSSIINTVKNFTFTPAQEMLANQDYYIGMAESKGYYMAAQKANMPTGIFFTAAIDGSNLLAFDGAYFGIEPVIAGPDVKILQTSTVMCEGESMILTAAGATNYTWTTSVFNPIDDPNDNPIIVTPSGNEIYYLFGVDDAGCSNSTSSPIAVNECLGLWGNPANENLEVYPNPSVNGKFRISGLERTATVTIYNILGELLFSKESEQESVDFDLSERPQGTYLIKVTDAKGNCKTMKLLNQH